jgi:TonB family protein
LFLLTPAAFGFCLLFLLTVHYSLFTVHSHFQFANCSTHGHSPGPVLKLNPSTDDRVLAEGYRSPVGDSARFVSRRRGYARPGEIDPSLVEAESLRPYRAPESIADRTNPTPLGGAPDSKATTLRSSTEPGPKPPSLAPPGNVDFRVAPLRPAVEMNPNRKSLAPAPGVLDAKPVAFRVGMDPNLNRANPASSKGLAPPPGIVEAQSVPLRPLEIHAPIYERRPVPPRPPVAPAPSGVNHIPLNSPPLPNGKTAMVRKNVSARFELLPDAQPRWNQIGLSAAGQLIFLGLLLLSPMVFPQTMQTALKFDVVELMQPVTIVPVPPAAPKPPTPRPQPKIKHKPKAPELKPEVPMPPPELPQLSPKQPHVFLNLKPTLPKAHTVEEKPVELKPILKATEIVLTSNGPKAPPAPATVVAPLNKVQTGGFGDPNGIVGKGNPNRGANINQAGSPYLPGGLGHGNGSGGARGLRGTVASGGSARGISAAGSPTAGVTILYKPNPAYSPEGRARKVQGDVILEVVFLASGQVQVIHVVSGLDYGMDEEAIQAAKRIRFTPAQRDGQPVDFPARLRIEFRLVEVE